MCVAEKEFKISGVSDCLSAGFPARRLPGIRYGRAGELDGRVDRRRTHDRGGRSTDSATASDPARNTMRRSRKVKILATLGPASSDEAMIQQAVRSGRRRVPHQYEPHRPRPDAYAGRPHPRGRGKVGRPIGILADLQGPKLRVGKFADGKEELSRRPDVHARRQSRARRRDARAPAASRNPEGSCKPGDRLLIDDGKLTLLAEKRRAGRSSHASSPAQRSPTRRASACPTRCRSAR
jgi:hypothetical protein